MQRARIAILVDKSAPFYVGGYEDRYWNIGTRLVESCDVRVYTSLPTRQETVAGVEFHRLSPSSMQTRNAGSRSPLHSLAFSVGTARNPFANWRPDVVLVEAIPYVHLPILSRWIRDADYLRVLNVNEAWWNYRVAGGGAR